MFELELEQKERPLEEGVHKKIVLGVVFFFIATTIYVVDFNIRKQCPYWLNLIILTIAYSFFIGCIINVVECVQIKHSLSELKKLEKYNWDKGVKFATSKEELFSIDLCQGTMLKLLEEYTDSRISGKVYLKEGSKPDKIVVWVCPEYKGKSKTFSTEYSILKDQYLSKINNLLEASAKT